MLKSLARLWPSKKAAELQVPAAAPTGVKPQPKRKTRIRGMALAKALEPRPGKFTLTPLTEAPAPENPFEVVQPPKDTGATLAMDDGMVAFFNQLGTTINFNEGIGFLGYSYLAQLAQRPEYRKGSEVLAREMTRKWIKFTSQGDADNSDKIKQIEAEFKRLKVRKHFRRAMELDGFFGRAHIYIDTGATDDPEELKTPLVADKRKIRKGSMKRITTVEPFWTYPQQYNSNDPLAKNFFKPQTWMVNSKEVHHTRLMTFVGREVPDMLKPAYAFGGLSLSQMAKPYVDNWLRTRQSVSDLLHSFTVFVLKTDLSDTFSGADDGDQLFTRVDLFNKVRDNRGMMVLDKGTPQADNAEELENVSAPLGTLDHLQAQAQEQMSSVFSIPLVILLGITPSGLNASSDGEIRVFYDFIKAFQEHMFTDPLEVLLKVVQLNLFGEVDENIGFEYIPLWQLDEAAMASVRKTEADTDGEYVTMGAISNMEVRQKLVDNKDGPWAHLDMGVDPLAGQADEFGLPPDDDDEEGADLNGQGGGPQPTAGGAGKKVQDLPDPAKGAGTKPSSEGFGKGGGAK